MSKMPPFFILGCVRSGTTILRDCLKAHPNLEAPEETHVFRWGEPFKSPDFNHLYKTAETLKYHRKIDGVSEDEFSDILESSKDRREFFLNYLSAFSSNKKSNVRCFDKTPQNVYGIPLIKSYFPKARFIHIVRHPLNVIASLKLGKTIGPMSVEAGINYWKESIMIINSLKPLWGKDIYELRYEDFCKNPQTELNRVLEFIDETCFGEDAVFPKVNDAQDSYKNILDQNEQELVQFELSNFLRQYNYQ